MKPRAKCGDFSGFKAKSSIKLCEERLACKGSKPVSVFYCLDCGTHQCDLCESLLHEDQRLLLHVREPVLEVSQEILCDGECPERNYANVTCSSCKAKFCYFCDRKVHAQKPKKTHARSRFLPDLEEFVSCEDIPLDSEETDDDTMMSMKSLDENFPDLITEKRQFQPEKRKLSGSSFLLIDDKEQFQVKDEEEFAQKLGCDRHKSLKVVSIFGNTGDGKSYTLNHTFFQGDEVFKTCPSQYSCTVGVWAALCPTLNVIAVDTEGFLGQASNPNNRDRMLLKILAISDIIVYRTRAERLYDDMFRFLGDASHAYIQHFSKELEEVSSRCNIKGPPSLLGPAVIIFHETCNTNPLSEDAEIVLRTRFQELGKRLDAFSSLHYVGVKTRPTDFGPFQEILEKQVKNLSVRVARSPDVIFKMLKVLTVKFSENLENSVPNMFPDQYFTCTSHCLSCKCRCSSGMNHVKEGLPHSSSASCVFQYQFENRVLFCKACFERGEKIVVTQKMTESNDSIWSGLVKYAWSGYILECSKCGVIYRSREHWYGNKDPWEQCAQTEYCHVWPDVSGEVPESENTAQYVLDNLSSISEVVSYIGAKPTKAISSWVADQIAPSYWVPNSQAKCGICKAMFDNLERKHHCRICGGAFCDTCSSDKLPVSGWGSAPVRVCKTCFEDAKKSDEPSNPKDPEAEITARKIGEVVQSTLSSVISFPVGIIKSKARPTYWVPDELLTNCYVCEKPFTEKRRFHHCRSCGEGVCHPCSTAAKPVPSRGWKYPVRVCNKCVEEEEDKA